MRRLLIIIGVIVITVFGLWLTVYFLPKNTGDRFASRMRSADVAGMEDLLCDETTLGQVTGLLREGGGQIGIMLAQLLGSPVQIGQMDALDHLEIVPSLNVINGEYTWHYRLNRDMDIIGFRFDAGLESPDFSLTINRTNIVAPCVQIA